MIIMWLEEIRSVFHGYHELPTGAGFHNHPRYDEI